VEWRKSEKEEITNRKRKNVRKVRIERKNKRRIKGKGEK
jgi:hypothetical protein